MAILICGSFAYDNIMVFPDRFRNHILPEKVHILNVCFVVPEMRREFGGCAGNIAYNLKLLGGEPLPMGTVGHDFGPYAEWMNQCDIPQTHVRQIDDTYTAQAYITTDMDDNQITAFHPGAMSAAHQNRIEEIHDVALGIVSPDGKRAMVEHAEQFANFRIPFVFDPGQGLPMFDVEELKTFIDQANFITVNDYESQLLQERVGMSLQNIAAQVDALIVTKGAKGSEIFADSARIKIPIGRVTGPVDPTGCGDAFRAGLLYGITTGKDWDDIGRLASLLGAINIEHHGTQNHHFTVDEFAERFRESFGYSTP